MGLAHTEARLPGVSHNGAQDSQIPAPDMQLEAKQNKNQRREKRWLLCVCLANFPL